MIRHQCTLLAGLVALLLAPGFALAQADKPADVSGEWEMTAETPAGTFTSTMKLERTGSDLAGTMTGRNGEPRKLTNLKVVGNTLTFERDLSFNGMDLHLVYTGTVEGDTIKGTFTAGDQKMNWSARRKSAPAAAPRNVSNSGGPVTAPGTWKITFETPNGPREQTLILKQDGGRLTGTISGFMGQENALQEVSLMGKELRFTYTIERNGETRKRTGVATLDGDTLKGTFEGGNNPRPFTGKREAAPVVATGLAGTWKLSVQAPDQTHRPTLVLVEQGGQWSGKLVRDGGAEDKLKQVTVNGNQLKFVVDLEINGETIHLEFTGTLEGSALKGAIAANGMDLPTTGERAPTT